MSQECPRCHEEVKLRARVFSDQALAAFLAWGELSPAAVGKSMCDACYAELRDILIEHGEAETSRETGNKKSHQKVS